jgi:hypothetical protein
VARSNGHAADHWQTFRLFLMPFCVSSFSALIKGHGYFLIFPSQPRELFWSCAACALFLAAVAVIKQTRRAPHPNPLPR